MRYITIIFLLMLVACSLDIKEYYEPCRHYTPCGNCTSDSESRFKNCEWINIGNGQYIFAQKRVGSKIPFMVYCFNGEIYELCK